MATHEETTEPVAPLYVSLDHAGVRVGLHPRTIRRGIAAGELTGYRFGKAIRGRLDELDAWAESKAMPNPRDLEPVKAGHRQLGGATA